MKETPYGLLHDKTGPKFFCFSNIFPGGQKEIIEEGQQKRLLISSPSETLLNVLVESLHQNRELNIGDMQFSCTSVQKLPSKITSNCVIKTATPIIIRIPQYRYAEYGIHSQYTYAFWKPEHDFNAFLKQLSENIIKKYNEYHKAALEDQPLFQQFMYDGSYPIHPVIDHQEQTFIGSYWKFVFSGLTKEQQTILQFAVDCGFGELNSMGFGFVNVV
ncbi:MAG: CRISPR-associated endoribonuclease Cas6 [Candidatus Aenigmarchaeota archaeon]|nr:CRISPR-associated endoribonuclease Cas6 [Candidatus Aenigmarchaeota archaeon]